MDLKTKRTIGLIVAVVAILAIVGTVSYAYFSTMGETRKVSGGFTTGTMQLRFADNDEGISATLDFGDTITKKFLIENTGTLDASLSIDWVNLINTYTNGSLIYKLLYSETEDGEYKEMVPSTNVPVSDKPLTQTMDSEISVPAGKTYYYNLVIELVYLDDVDQTSDIDASFSTNFGAGNIAKYRYYKLTVDPNGGTWETFTSPQEYLLKNKETKTISNPTRTGYTFNGWDVTGEGSTLENDLFSMGMDSSKITARWTANTYKLIINGEERDVHYGDTVDLGDPSKEGYTFTGWETTGGTITGNTLTITDDKNITVTPTYTVNNYKYIVYHNQMNLSGNGYTLVSADTDEGEAAYDTTFTPPVKTYTGFTSPATQSMTIKAETVYPPVLNRVNYNYDRKQYTLTTQLNGGSASGIPSSMYYGANTTLPTPTKTGYNFTNWTTTSGELNGNSFTMGDANATITANYTPKEFSVTFNANGGTTTTASKTVTYDSTYGDLPTPTYDGYNFSGWFTAMTGGTEVTSSTKVSLNGNQTLYARWEAESVGAAGTLIAKANDINITDYNSGNKGEMFAFEHPSTEQTEALTDYRYIGNTPNNYIDFNNETWRIIGVFTVETESGEKEQLMKIIRDESIGDLKWDSSSINEWSTASLKTLLNGDYYNQKGSYASTSTAKGLSSTARSQIANVKWYLGGSRTSNLGGSDYYAFERGTKVYSGRSTNIIAKVGIMYPSDYVYTYANGVDNTCYTDVSNCKSNKGGTPANGWLFKNGTYEWTLSPIYDEESFVLLVNSDGSINTGANASLLPLAVRPTVFLASDTVIVGGDGSTGNHYKLG